MLGSAHFNEILAAEQFTQPVDDMAGMICDLAVADGLQFSESFDGRHSVSVIEDKNESSPESVSETEKLDPAEQVPHNPAYISTRLDDNENKLRYAGYDNIDTFARANGIHPRSIRASFTSVLRWSPEEHVIRGKGDYRGDGIRVGIKLNALPVVAQEVSKMYPATVYNNGSKESNERAKEIFLAFCEAALAPSKEK